MTPSRETIMQALFARLETAGSFATASRRLRLWTALAPADAPALFLAERSETRDRPSEATPGRTTLEADIFLYTYAGEDPNAVPASSMNALLDSIDAALAPDPVTGTQTLGGLVSHCWIAGKILNDPGDLDGKGVAILPVKILVP